MDASRAALTMVAAVTLAVAATLLAAPLCLAQASPGFGDLNTGGTGGTGSSQVSADAGRSQAAAAGDRTGASQLSHFKEGLDLLARARSFNYEGQQAEALLKQALTRLLAVIGSIEQEFGLDGSGSRAVAPESVKNGLTKANMLNQCYVSAAKVNEQLYRASRVAGAPKKEYAGKALAYYWQAVHTGYFRFRDETVKPHLTDISVISDPTVKDLLKLGNSASREMNDFLLSLVKAADQSYSFDENRSFANKGQIMAYQRMVDEQFATLNTTSKTFAADALLQYRGPGELDGRQKAANTLSEVRYRIGQEYLQAARGASGQNKRLDDWVLSLRSLEKAAIRVYWVPVRRFDLNQQQVVTIAKSVIGTFFSSYLPAEALAKMTGLSTDQVVAAQQAFTEQLVKFIDLGAPNADELAQVTGGTRRLTPDQINRLVDDARANNQTGFRQKIVSYGLAREGDESTIKKYLDGMKAILNEKVTVNGYWVAVSKDPDYPAKAREAYFAAVKESLGIEVPVLRSMTATDELIRKVVRQRSAGTGSDAGAAASTAAAAAAAEDPRKPKPEAQKLYDQLRGAISQAESLVVGQRYADAIKLVQAQLPLLQRLEKGDKTFFKDAPATYSNDSFPEVRSRLLNLAGDAESSLAATPGVAEEDRRTHLRQALQYWFQAADQGALVEVIKLRAERNRAEGGDTRLPGRLTDDFEKAGKRNPLTENEQAVIASQKLNGALRDLIMGTDGLESSDFVAAIVQAIIREAENPRLDRESSTYEDARTKAIRAILDGKFREMQIYMNNEDLEKVANEVLTAAIEERDPTRRKYRVNGILLRILRENKPPQSVTASEMQAVSAAVDAIMKDQEATTVDDRESYDTYQKLLEKWGHRVEKGEAGAVAMSRLFYRLGEEHREKAVRSEQHVVDLRAEITRLEAEKKAAEDRSDSDKATKLGDTITQIQANLEVDRKVVGESYVKSLQFYFMATRRVYFGTERAFAIQLPELDAALFLAWRGAMLVKDLIQTTGAVRRWAASSGGAEAGLFKSFFKAPAGAGTTFALEGAKKFRSLSVSKFWVEVSKNWRVPVEGAAAGAAGRISIGRAAGSVSKGLWRGIAGTAKTPLGKVLSLGALGLFIYMNYAHFVELKENAIIVVPDDGTATAAQQNFWALVDGKALRAKEAR